MVLINLGQDHLPIEYFYDVRGDSDDSHMYQTIQEKHIPIVIKNYLILNYL